ncbi:hypothetical protein [Sporosarcina sp. G11-34]|uniref:hypothetical protein n=1 Tax=Sporosarcina sp. G11-34 TaxID=2849605 RepID=UPI0022A9C6F3|nr:hypothetical protein [Sporosarcina sp. G11-34]MCZ2260757.1 hypothetical protein [Sporosarcina sp. G11-34]
MEEKKQYRFRLSDELDSYIEDYTLNNEIPREDKSEGLARIIREHKELSKRNWNLGYVTDTITENVTQSVQTALQKSISKEITKVRLGTNNADKNTQILIELLQGFMQMQNMEHIMTTDLNKPEFLSDVENLVQDRINLQKQKKDNHIQKER